ncbi:hypothetical protein B0E53_00861 [Micromonospora sp. MH33]|uniref:ISAs1 family transposase n=1 Tax=Micromonospora sp. MH33 TaxID=1945509 RepID=UPI000D2D4465|nr:ISAs1 family transposase [Micromonospora sp. MH33]PSK67133.1 hypothetical protein B0E53_00861 [Micromonospora sp. MH33]
MQHTASASGHGRRESRSIKTCTVADELGGIAFPHARLAIRVHRRRKQSGKHETRESVYAVTSLDAHQASPADLAAAIRGHWAVENSSHHIRDVTFAEDASTIHPRTAPRAMAACPPDPWPGVEGALLEHRADRRTRPACSCAIRKIRSMTLTSPGSDRPAQPHRTSRHGRHAGELLPC